MQKKHTENLNIHLLNKTGGEVLQIDKSHLFKNHLLIHI